MKTIDTIAATRPRGHYSQAIVHGGLVFVSGQLPIDADGNPLPDASVADQTKAVLGNIDTILRAAGSGLDRALQVTIYVSDMAFWDEVNAAYVEVLGDHRPTRAVIPVGTLHHGVALEVQTIAAA